MSNNEPIQGGPVRRDSSLGIHEGARSAGPERRRINWDVISPRPTVIKVIGVGGAGCNAVQSMIDQGFEGVEFYAINTDIQSLQRCTVPNRIQIGEKLTQGCGAGSIPAVGEQAAREAEDQLREILQNADMVFITAGMGGGTGTGAAPVIAEMCRDMDILNVAVVTKPFHFEGQQRMRRAQEGVRKLGEHVDTMVTILNDKLTDAVGPKTAVTEAFDVANSVLGQGIRAISDLIALPGLINVDFRDVRTIMGQTGGAVMGVGEGKGENRAVEAVRKACHSPLQEKIVIDGAKGVLINITGPATITMHEINEATSMVSEAADPDANIIFGVVIDENMHDAMRVTIIATGFVSADGQNESSHTDTSHTVRPRVNPLTGKVNPLVQAGDPGPQQKEADQALNKPAILNKREREGLAPAPPKVDFNSPENPMATWGPKPVAQQQVQPQAFSLPPREEEHVGAVNGGGEAIMGGKMMNDFNGKSEVGEDPYDVPALQRRRRQRFFE